MTPARLRIFSLVLILPLLAREGRAVCSSRDMVRGWRVHEGQCHSGIGCKADFKFPTEAECKASISKGPRRGDVCSTTPCANGGLCTQVTGYGQRYKCKCEGTGFYGDRCQYPCPIPGKSSVKVFPYECFLI